MKILVAGSEGLLGSVISEYYENTGHQVVRVDRKLGHDLTSETQVKALVSTNPDASVLINLFALNPQPGADRFTVFNVPIESVGKYLRLNCEALFMVCREFAAVCPKGSSIVNFASTYGLVSPRPGLYPTGTIKHPGYTITKAGVVGLTRWLAVYLAPHIRVNCIAPGGVENGQSATFLRSYAEQTPMGRMMKKEEIIGPVKFLASDDSSYVTGATLVCDGGYTAW